MNELSWLIYFAGLADSAKIVALLTAIVLGGGGAVCLIIALAHADDYGDEGGVNKRLSRAAKFGTWALAAAIVLCVIPSRQTIMLIAASEMGQKVVQSDAVSATATRAHRALNKWLDTYLAEERP